jgi:hypothetical protein
VVRCTEVATGKEVLKDRSPVGPVWGSLILAGGKLYATGRNGETLVFAPDPAKFAALAVNKLGEPTNATPAFSDGAIFLRTSKSLFCVGAK